MIGVNEVLFERQGLALRLQIAIGTARALG
jgi:hypothetical protein